MGRNAEGGERARLADSDVAWTIGERQSVNAEVRSGPNG